MYLICLIVFLVLTVLASVINFIHYMHMFQLNSYHAKEQIKWMGINIGDVLIRTIPFIISAGYIFTASVLFSSENPVHMIVAGVISLMAAILPRKKPVKKKLVYTPRVIRMCVSWGIIYAVISALIVALMYGNNHMPLLISAFNVLNLFGVIIANVVNKPVEAMINRHYINDAKRIIRELPNLTVVGLTGSYGKTSTKFYLEKLLSAKYNVLMTPESYNTTMGVVKTVRGSLNATYDIFLCEMGAKGVGEIKEICDIVNPKHGIITSIGPQHLESFGSIENIIKTKFELANAVGDGFVVLNYDNEYIKNNPCNKNIVTYGLKEGNQYYADNISVSEKGTAFTLHHGHKAVEFSTPLIGSHNVQNIVGAIAMANSLGVELEKLVLPVRRLECVPHRLQIIKGKSSVIIDDAFNSNPTGAKAALDTLAVFEGYKVLVTPGMIELGEKEYELNKRFGEQAAAVCDFVIAVGKRQAVPITDGLKQAGYPDEKTYVAENLKDALAKAESLDPMGKKKIVLLENDLPDNY